MRKYLFLLALPCLSSCYDKENIKNNIELENKSAAQLANEGVNEAAAVALGEGKSSEQSIPNHYRNSLDYIKDKCFSRNVFFRDRINDGKEYGILSVAITKNNQVDDSAITLYSPACRHMRIQVDIIDVADAIEKVADTVDVENPICAGDVCGLASTEINFGFISDGLMQFDKTGLSYRIKAIHKISRANVELDVEFTDKFIADLDQVLTQEYKFVNPDY